MPNVLVWNKYGSLVVWLVQAPVFAFLIVALFGRQLAGPTWATVENGIASTTFGLAIAAIWLGCSLAVADTIEPLPAPRPGLDPIKLFVPFGVRVAKLLSLCVIGVRVLFAMIYLGSRMRGSWLSMYLVVLITSSIGLFLGMVVAALTPEAGNRGLGLADCLHRHGCARRTVLAIAAEEFPFRIAAAATPTRWAFEGLLLLESAKHHPAVIPAETGDRLSQDVV